MGKDQQPQPQPYPVQVPLAPPSYDDAMKNIQTNVPYASAPSAGLNLSFFKSNNLYTNHPSYLFFIILGFIPPQPFAGGTYVQQPPVIEVQRKLIII